MTILDVSSRFSVLPNTESWHSNRIPIKGRGPVFQFPPRYYGTTETLSRLEAATQGNEVGQITVGNTTPTANDPLLAALGSVSRARRTNGSMMLSSPTTIV